MKKVGIAVHQFDELVTARARIVERAGSVGYDWKCSAGISLIASPLLWG